MGKALRFTEVGKCVGTCVGGDGGEALNKQSGRCMKDISVSVCTTERVFA